MAAKAPALKPCALCPAAMAPDEEAVQMLRWVRDGVVPIQEATYPCAFRRASICTGIVEACIRVRDGRMTPDAKLALGGAPTLG